VQKINLDHMPTATLMDSVNKYKKTDPAVQLFADKYAALTHDLRARNGTMVPGHSPEKTAWEQEVLEYMKPKGLLLPLKARAPRRGGHNVVPEAPVEQVDVVHAVSVEETITPVVRRIIIPPGMKGLRDHMESIYEVTIHFTEMMLFIGT
jgi:hypothetical protein